MVNGWPIHQFQGVNSKWRALKTPSMICFAVARITRTCRFEGDKLRKSLMVMISQVTIFPNWKAARYVTDVLVRMCVLRSEWSFDVREGWMYMNFFDLLLVSVHTFEILLLPLPSQLNFDEHMLETKRPKRGTKFSTSGDKSECFFRSIFY